MLELRLLGVAAVDRDHRFDDLAFGGDRLDAVDQVRHDIGVAGASALERRQRGFDRGGVARGGDTAVSAQASALQGYVQFQTLSQQRISTVATVAEQRFNWSGAMQQIALALPPTVTINSLNGNTGAPGPTGPGAADSASFTASGCATTQLVVAELITRFRALKDVSGVTVSTYSKPVTVSLKRTDKVAYGSCAYVTWSMSFTYNAGYGIPAPKLPSGVIAVRG